jgi:hypothetical protein
MRYAIIPSYHPIQELPYCCVPAVLQMIQQRRGFPFASQETIGYQLGLIVPPEAGHYFKQVRIGVKPEAGYGTQTGKPEYSLTQYFIQNKLPLVVNVMVPLTYEHLLAALEEHLSHDHDVIICYNSYRLFGAGDVEHVSLVASFDTITHEIVIIDPAKATPSVRITTCDKLFDALRTHANSDHGGLWIIS